MKWFQIFEYLQANAPKHYWPALIEYAQLMESSPEHENQITKHKELELFLIRKNQLYLKNTSRKGRVVWMLEIKQLLNSDLEPVVSTRIERYYLKPLINPLIYSSSYQKNDYRSKYFFKTQTQAESFLVLLRLSIKDPQYHFISH